MHGFAIAEVVQSRDARFSPGEIVEGWVGWQDYASLPGDELLKRDGERSLVDLISVFGMTGLTGYYSLLEVGQIRAGETVLVSAAAGAVGSIAGQIAKIAGCRVVGVAGGPEKCAWIQQGLGFDAAVDYKAGNLVRALRAACPDGVDVYLDNVAGDVLDGALRVMNLGGRIVCCGMVSSYDNNLPQPGSPLLPGILMARRLHMLGFILLDHLGTRAAAETRLARWLAEGRLKSIVDMAEGLEQAPAALVSLLAGGNRGKKAVRVA